MYNNAITKDPTTPQVFRYTSNRHGVGQTIAAFHFIDRAIGQWRRRLKWVVPQQGEQIEHLM